jgi:hypothetical protein
VVSVDPFFAKIIASSRAGCVWLAFSPMCNAHLADHAIGVIGLIERHHVSRDLQDLNGSRHVIDTRDTSQEGTGVRVNVLQLRASRTDGQPPVADDIILRHFLDSAASSFLELPPPDCTLFPGIANVHTFHEGTDTVSFDDPGGVSLAQ